MVINEIKVNEDAEVKGNYISDILKLSEPVKDDRKKLHIIRMKQKGDVAFVQSEQISSKKLKNEVKFIKSMKNRRKRSLKLDNAES